MSLRVVPIPPDPKNAPWMAWRRLIEAWEIQAFLVAAEALKKSKGPQ